MVKFELSDAGYERRLQSALRQSRRRALRAQTDAASKWVPVISGVMAALLVWVFVADYRAKQDLRKRGVSTLATVDAFYRPCPPSRRACASRIAYSFRVPGGRFAGQVFRVDTTEHVPAWPSAKVGPWAPIVFDPANPSNSALNYGDVAVTTDPTAELGFGIGLAIAVAGFMNGLVLLGKAVVRRQGDDSEGG